MRVDIGVFAHNEALGIVKMIDGLVRQEFAGLDARILVIANGCADDTVELARAFVQSGGGVGRGVRIEVFELTPGGKSRTWNRYVHELSRPDADVLIFADADIDLPEPDSLLRLVRGLSCRPGLHAFNSHPIKDIVHRPENLSMMDKVIAMGSETMNHWKTAICGSLYAMPSGKARLLHMPIGLAVEDGFLRAMILTDVLTGEEDFSRISGGDVFHVFASERSVLSLIRHQVRIIIGSTVNSAAFNALRAIPPDHRRAALADVSRRDDWLSGVIRSQLPRWSSGWIPWRYLTKRVRYMARPPRKLLHPRQMLVLVVGFGFDLVVYVCAQVRMARGVGAGYW